jgi:murein DD-endopeptidase MepM/ murein hydrolase activator NlpD
MRSFLRIKAASLVLVLVLAPLSLHAASIEDLQSQLQQQQEQLKKAEDQIAQFQQKLQQKKQEARTLTDQIGIIDDSIDSVQLNLNKTQSQIATTATQIEEVGQEIDVQEKNIADQKIRLAEYIRQIHKLDDQSTVTVFLKYQTFSEALSEAQTFAELHTRAQETLVAIQQLRDDLATKQRDLQDYKTTLDALRTRQRNQEDQLSGEKNSKSHILEQTHQKESEFQSLLKQAQASHEAAQAEIGKLDSVIRAQLDAEGKGNLPHVGIFDWPIQPIYGISCKFHCAGYPFAYLIGPHTGTDIPTSVGTPIQAPADGYVARTHDSGGSGYSYIMVVHGDNLTTVYGHVSGFAVKEGQMVTRGTVIGYTGGAPGMHGAGLSSGPHLHFEVRLNDITVDGLDYLPSSPYFNRSDLR